MVYNKIINILNEICEEENKKLKSENKNLIYEVFQLSDLNQNKFDGAYLISKFYNENFFGNIDYMHIPDFEQTMENIKKFPILIAREENSKKILGISILKYFDPEIEFDPYFPNEKSKYFSVTGILTNVENKDLGFYGIGKKIYELALDGVLNYKQNYDDVKLMCVIDCRNNYSIDALRVASNNLNKKYQKQVIDSMIVGYYKVEDENTRDLTEAPTFVIEMKMNDLDKKESVSTKIKYENLPVSKEELYLKMQKTIDDTFEKSKEQQEIKSIDPGCGIVTYYPLVDNKYLLNNLSIDSNDTEKGNDRIPIPQSIFNTNVKRKLLEIFRDDLASIMEKGGKTLIKKYNV